MAGSKASPTITGRGAGDKPQPARPQGTTNDRSRFRGLFAWNKNLSNGSLSASSSTSTLVAGSTALAAPATVAVTTPSTTPRLETAATSTEAPIAELWNEAWDELRENAALFEEYETRLAAFSSPVGLPGAGKSERAQVMKVLLEKKIAELESGRWKVGFQNNQFSVKDLIESVVGVVDWAKEYIGKAAQASPYSSVAWAGVCLLLPLVLNPGEQEAARAKCLEGIAALLRQCVIREALYRSSYDGNTSKKEANLSVHISYREELKILYVKILTFQATCLCHLSHRTGGRIVRDMVDWTDWNKLSTAIDTQKERMTEIETQWRDFKLQEQWNVEEKRHIEQMNCLNPIYNEIRRVTKITEKAQNDKIRQGLLKWLSDEDFSARYNDIRRRHEESTGDWLIENDRYNDWKKRPSSFLWLYGKAGSGKSFLSASAVHNLAVFCEKWPFEALAYYYFSFTDQTDPDASRMLSSMIRQLCGARHDNPAWLHNLGSTFKDKGANPTLEHLEHALWNAVAGFDAVYLIIDSLDECTTSKSKRATLMKSLVRLQKCSPPNVHILVTSRKEPDIEAALDRIPLTPEDKIDLLHFRDAVDHDMGIFVQQRLDSPEFDDVSDETKVLAKSSLLEKADGMFQYVALQLIEIENSLSEDIPAILANLPQGLDETYVRMLKRIDPQNYKLVYRILRWLAMSQKPLTAERLAEAAVVDPEAQPPFDPSKRLKGHKNSSGLLKMLPGLLVDVQPGYYIDGDPTKDIFILQGKRRITFSHYSVKEFLFSTNLKMNPQEEVSRYALYRDEAECFIAKSCMCYHLYASQAEVAQKDTYKKLFPLWKYAAKRWASHMEALDEKLWTDSLKDKVLSVLKPNTGSFLNMIRINSRALSHQPLSFMDLDVYPVSPLYYLSANGYHRILSLYLKDLDAEQLHSLINYPTLEPPGSYGTPLQAAARNGSKETVKLLLAQGVDVNAQGGFLGNALQAAALGESKEIVELLLEQGANVNAQGGEYGTALLAAATSESGESEEIVKLLLEKGANVNAQGGDFGTALQATSYRGSEEVVELLLTKGANINAQGGEYGTALQAASCRGSERIVKLLLEKGAAVNAQGGYHGCALQAAAAATEGSEVIVKLLLEYGANVNAQGGSYDNALVAAAHCRNEEALGLLLEHGANVNAQCGPDFGTALQAAAYKGEEGIVRMLLEHGADINAPNSYFGSALQAAAAGDNSSDNVAILLLEKGADINSQGGRYGNALQRAADEGNIKIVKLLLEQGVNVNAQGGYHGNALQAAARQRRDEVFTLLIEQGADINAQGGKNGNTLHAAAVGRSKNIFNFLLEQGLDIESESSKYGNALQAAARGGSKTIFEALLQRNANVNAKGGKYGNTLQAAAAGSGSFNTDVLNLLLELGVDVNAQGGKYGNALQAAAKSFFPIGTVRILLEHGADVNAKGGKFGNALQAAAAGGSKDVVEILLQHGAEVNAQGGKFGNALQAAVAAKILDLTLVYLLLEQGADVNAQGGKHGTALKASRDCERDDIMQLLLAHGAVKS